MCVYGISLQWVKMRLEQKPQCAGSPHHVRDELPPLFDQSAAHGSLLLVQCLVQPLPHHHHLLLGRLLELRCLLCR